MTAPGFGDVDIGSFLAAPAGWRRAVVKALEARAQQAAERLSGYPGRRLPRLHGLVGARLVEGAAEQRPGPHLHVVRRERAAVGARSLPGGLQDPELRVVDVAADPSA